jgi:TonB family protein
METLLTPRMLVSFLLLIAFPNFLSAQGPISPPASRPQSLHGYENSSDGLRWQLQDILNAARVHDRSKEEVLLRQTEIPNYKEWFPKTFGSEKGSIWAGSYARNLDRYRTFLEGELSSWVDQDGEFVIRRVKNDPATARKIETGMLDALRDPVDIFFASWKKRETPQEARLSPIGYFVFLEGRFRLNSAISSTEIQVDSSGENAVSQAVPPSQPAAAPDKLAATEMANNVSRPGVGGIGYPSCDSCPDPKYTKLARKKGLEGVVVLQGIIQADGTVSDLQVVKSPDNELTQMALAGVSKWHMNPARRMDGRAVPVLVPFEITFRLLK